MNSEIQEHKIYDSTKFVHIFPHSHTDLGWLGTIDEYFNGFSYYNGGSVNQILSSVFE